MAARITAAQDLWLNADRTLAVPGGPAASFLICRKGKPVPAEYAALVTRTGNPKRAAAKSRKGGSDKSLKDTDDKQAQ